MLYYGYGEWKRLPVCPVRAFHYLAQGIALGLLRCE